MTSEAMKKGLFVGALAVVVGVILHFQNAVPRSVADTLGNEVKGGSAEASASAFHYPSQVEQMQRSLFESGVLTVKELEDWGSVDAEIRAEAVRSLGMKADLRGLGVLVEFLGSDTDARVRVQAAGVLEFFNTEPMASLALVRALSDRDASVRDHALLSLRAHRNDRVQKALLLTLKNGSLPKENRDAVAAFLDRYYVHLDPFENPFRSADGS